MLYDVKPSAQLNRRAMLLSGTSVIAAAGLIPTARAQGTNPSPAATDQRSANGRKPNILVIFGDDLGQTKTPIDQVQHGINRQIEHTKTTPTD